MKILLIGMYNDTTRFWKSTLSWFEVIMAQGCIGYIGCYADKGENGSVAMPMGVKIAVSVAHI